MNVATLSNHIPVTGRPFRDSAAATVQVPQAQEDIYQPSTEQGFVPYGRGPWAPEVRSEAEKARLAPSLSSHFMHAFPARLVRDALLGLAAGAALTLASSTCALAAPLVLAGLAGGAAVVGGAVGGALAHGMTQAPVGRLVAIPMAVTTGAVLVGMPALVATGMAMVLGGTACGAAVGGLVGMVAAPLLDCVASSRWGAGAPQEG